MNTTLRFSVTALCVAAAWIGTIGPGKNSIAADRPARDEAVAEMDKARMDAAIRFGETVLKHGRDVYGEKHTPLFTDVLDIDTMKAPEKMYICHLKGNPCPRRDQPWQPTISSNLSYQCNLMRALAGLSNLTGDPKYKEAYKDAIRYYFAHYQTVAGVLEMGHHTFIDLNADGRDGDNWPPGDRGHEMKGDFPYYELFWETDPDAARKMLAGHWNCHIKNWNNMDFTRHGQYNKVFNEGVWDRPMGEPVKGIVRGDLTFFGSGCDILWSGGKLAELDEDEKPLAWTKRLLARYIDCSDPKTGIPPCHHTSGRDFGRDGMSWPEYSMLYSGVSNDVFGTGATVLMRLGEGLGEKGEYFTKSVHEYLKAYPKYAYNPKDNTFRTILHDGTDLSVYDDEGGGSIWKAHPSYMISYALCYRQSEDREIWDTLRSICRGNDLGDIGQPGGKSPKLNLATSESDPRIIFALVEIFRATDDRVYLDLARVVGNNALKARYRADKGLFVNGELERIANLNVPEPLAFLTLEAALHGKLDKVPTYDGSEATSPSGGIIRPNKVLPYHPTTSYCLYGRTVLAVCDEMIPANSNDSSIPCLSWFRFSSLGGPRKPVVATFPDVLDGPVTITGIADAPTSRNQLNGMTIDSPHKYTFAKGALQAMRDFTITVLRGDHVWDQVVLYPHGKVDYVMDIAEGSRFTSTGTIYEYHGPKNSCGVVKTGDGTAVVTGDHASIYSPDPKASRVHSRETVIKAGTLLVNNATGSGVSPRSAVEVNTGGTLGGNGAVGIGGTAAVVHVHAGGTIAPGSCVGTLTLRDGLTLHDGAKLACQLGTAGDLLKVTGGTLTGSRKGGVKVSVADSGGLAVGKTYDLIDWTGATPSGVDVDDFVVDEASKYQGKFNIDGSLLRITITGVATSANTTAAKTTKPKPTKLKTDAVNTWISPNGGEWGDAANWYGELVPNGVPKEWVQYRFEKPRKVSSVDVYWLDDEGDRLVPESWRVLYHQAGEWKPVEDAGEYGVARDQFNEVRFKEVETDRLRLEVKLQPGRYGGVLEWRVNP